MTTGFRNAAGIDFDDLFAPYTSGTKRPASGYLVGTQDLSDRYQAGTAGITTGYRNSSGTDLGSLYAAKSGGSTFAVNPTSVYQQEGSGWPGTFSALLSATGGTGSYAWSLIGSTAGVSLSSSSGANVTISWSPTSDSSRSFTVRCVSGTGTIDVPVEWNRGLPI